MVEARKLISNAKHFKERLPVLHERNFRRSIRKKPFFSLAGAGDNIPWTVTSVESYHWFKRFADNEQPQSILCKNDHESSSESIHGFFYIKKAVKNEFLGKKETKMTRKIIAIAIALVMCLSFAACGNNEENENVLRVAMECAYAPYNWTQNDDSNGAVQIAGTNSYAYGYDVMMAKLIAESMGKELEIVKLDWDALVPAVMSGDVDLVIAGQSITAERLEMVDFSDPYFYASIVTLTKADSAYANAASVADLAGATCTSQLGTIWYDICLPQIPDADILNAQENAPAMLVALDTGAVDLVVTDMPTALAATAVYGDMVLLDFTGTAGEFEVSEEEINLGISMKKGNAELLEAVNAVLATLTVEDYEAMMADAIAVQPLSE